MFRDLGRAIGERVKLIGGGGVVGEDVCESKWCWERNGKRLYVCTFLAPSW